MAHIERTLMRRTIRQRLFALLAGFALFASFAVALAPEASAGTRTCQSWYVSTWGRVTQCHDGTPNAFEIDFSDYGASDGMCVYLKALFDNNSGWYSFASSC